MKKLARFRSVPFNSKLISRKDHVQARSSKIKTLLPYIIVCDAWLKTYGKIVQIHSEECFPSERKALEAYNAGKLRWRLPPNIRDQDT